MIDLLLFDTEGFAVANVTETYDAKIFAAATVLSSVLVYNSMHLIDAKELEYVLYCFFCVPASLLSLSHPSHPPLTKYRYLDLLAHNTQLFSLKASTRAATDEGKTAAATPASSSFSLHDVFALPPLVWAVQAFTVDLKEETCTSWLTRMMKGSVLANNASAPLQQASANKRQRLRLGLDGLFPSVECQTLFLPATSRAALHNLSAVAPAQLTAEFREDVAATTQRILTSLRPKTQNNRPLSGPGLASLVRLIVEGLNQGQLFDIPSRWSSFSDHLRVSSMRAAVTHFEAEVSLGFRNVTPPLPAPDMASLVRGMRKEAIDLVPRLLVGLDKAAVRESVKGVETSLRELAYRLTRANEQQVRDYLRAQRDAGVAADLAAVEAFIQAELPMTSLMLKAWAKQREETLSRAYQAAQGVYKDEGKYTSEWRALQAQARGHSETARTANAAAMSKVLAAAEAACLQGYEAHMAASLGEAMPVLPSVVEGFHKPALENSTLVCLATGPAAAFAAEPQYKATVATLTKGVFAHYQALEKTNSGKLDTRCGDARQALVASAEALAKGLGKSTDEAGLEEAMGRVVAIRQSWTGVVAPLAPTAECRRHETMLSAQAEELVEKARQQVASNLKAALKVPLQEICKVVVEARCPSIHSARALRAAVDGECGKWVRRHEQVGAALTPSMVKRVLGLFVAEDLSECKAAVTEREKERYKRWARLGFTIVAVVVGTIVLMLLGAAGKLPKFVLEEAEAAEGAEAVSSGVAGTPMAARRRRRSSILGAVFSPFKG